MNTNTTPIAPIRPTRKADEWIETHLVRIARANGLRYPSMSDIERLRAIAVELGPRAESSEHDYLADLPTWAKKKAGSPIRYCPACFQEERFVRARWRLKGFEMCTKHNLHLKTGLVEPALCVTVNYPTRFSLMRSAIVNFGMVPPAQCLQIEPMHLAFGKRSSRPPAVATRNTSQKVWRGRSWLSTFLMP